MASTLSLDMEVDLALSDLDFFKEGRNLTQDEKAVLENPEDTWKVALVNGLTSEEQEVIGAGFKHFDYTHYMRIQAQWLEKERYLVGTRVGHSPNHFEINRDIQDQRTAQKYKLCYTLNHPDKTAFDLRRYPIWKEEIDIFLGLAEKQDPNHFPYYSTLARNSGLAA